MRRINYAIVFIITGLFLQVFWEGWLWSNLITHPKTSSPTDFSSFYITGRLARTGQYSHLYDIQSELAAQEQLTGLSLQKNELLPFFHPPILVPILQLVCTPDYLSSYWRWVLVMICLLVATGFVIDQMLRGMKMGSGSRILIILAALTFFPVFASLLKGQDTAFLLLGGMLWLYGMVTKKDSIAGLGLAMTIIRPQIAVVLAVPFLFKRRKVWWWFCGGAAGLAIYSLALVGFTGVRDYIQLLLLSGKGQGYGIILNAMFNVIGMLLRFFPQMNPVMVTGLMWGFFLIAILGLSILWKISPQIDLWHIALAVILSLFVAPHLYFHDLAFLLVPIMAVILSMGKRELPPGSMHPVVLLVAITLAILFAYLWDPLQFAVPYLLMAGLPLLAWWMNKPLAAD